MDSRPEAPPRLRARRSAALAALLLLAGSAPASALPLLSEVFYDAVGSDDGQTFVELYGAPGTSLEGAVLEVVNGSDGSVVTTVALAGAIAPDGLFVVADSLSDGTTLVPGADLLVNFDVRNAVRPCATGRRSYVSAPNDTTLTENVCQSHTGSVLLARSASATRAQ